MTKKDTTKITGKHTKDIPTEHIKKVLKDYSMDELVSIAKRAFPNSTNTQKDIEKAIQELMKEKSKK